ncbi:MAG: tetratricopeptide repeat protein [Pseudomonadota bacterium]
MSWLWPFGDDVNPNRDETIRSLEEREVTVIPSEPIENSAELARDNYRAFLDLVGDDPRLSVEAMRRLADIELEIHESQQLAENIDSLGEVGYDSAIRLYEQLLDRYPDYERNDMVRYQLARAYESAAQPESALTTLDALVQDYPRTDLIDEVQFRRGEMLFINKRYGPAEDAYGSVVDFGDESTFYEQSLYKLGWARFKQSFLEESFDPFFELLDRKLPDDTEEAPIVLEDSLSRAERELVADTFRVLSISFSYLDGAETIDNYLGRRAQPSYAHIIYANLGDLYLSKERFADAAGTYRAYVERDPLHFRAPLLQERVIEAYKQGGFPGEVLSAKAEFVERYGMDTAFWTTREREQHPAVVTSLKSNLDDLAQFYHAKAQQERSRPDYQTAARWYRKYLDYFPGEDDSANTNFLLAEILYESGDYAQATSEYETTAYTYALHDKSAEAGYAALLAYQRHEETLADPVQKNDWHQLYLDSGLRFADTYPEHPQAAPVMTTVAEDLFGQGQFDLAIAVARNVVAKQPEPERELLDTSWTVIAHSHFDLAQYAKAESAYLSLTPFIPANEVERQTEIRERIASSVYKQGEQARAAGDLAGAVSNFRRVGLVAVGSPIIETAEYDAASALIELEDWAAAASVLEQFRQTFPDSEFNEEATRKLAVVYLKGGDQGRAAEEFERMANATGATPDMRREALWQATDLYRDTGNPAKEAALLERIVNEYPEPLSESIEARLRLADGAGARNDSASRSFWLREIISADATAGVDRTDRSKFLAAKATLELAEPQRLAFSAMQLTIPLKQSLGVKKDLMEGLIAAYSRASDYGVAEVTTAATFRIGEAYQLFSRDLMESERPADLNADALEQYEILLEEQAFPFEEQAIDLYKANAARAADGVYDEWVRRSFDALAELLPARYAKYERSENALATLN